MKRISSFYLLLFVIAIACTSCNFNKINYPKESAVFGLASPVVLEKVQTDILMSDYFKDVSLIDSVSVPDALKAKLSKDKKILSLTPSDVNNIPVFSDLRVWIKGFPYSIPAKRSLKIARKYLFDPSGNTYKSVQLAGDFNSWNPKSTELEFKDGLWQIELTLNPGRYCYQVVADNKWMLDPANKEKADNNIGGVNSVMTIQDEFSEKAPVLFTEKEKLKKIIIGFDNAPDEIFIYWQNYRLTNKMIKKEGSTYIFNIPSDARKFERSFIRVWAYNKFGISNDLLIPLHKTNIINRPSLLKRDDKQSLLLYFLMVDRFNNGNKKNDKPVKDPEVSPKANYWGGDLAGITQKLKDGYFTRLGINSLWISPISQNPYEAYVEFPAPHRKYSGYHGYWPISSVNVDTRFGTPDEMKQLVTEAHFRGINIIMDYVSHHVHVKHPIYQMHPDWFTHLNLPDGRKNIRIWDEQRLTTWFDTFLPTLDFNRSQVVEMESDSAMYWVDNYDIDGFRHDATKHIPEVFWRRLTQKVKKVETEEKKNIYQIGETFGSRELIASYINSGELDAQFDFNLYFDARSAFAVDRESFVKLMSSMQESFDYFGYHNLMGNITGNHDLPRFISLASGSLAFNEDDKEAGWKRDIVVKDASGYKKLSMLTAFIMTIPGVPVIYYGDEIGMPGAGDPDNRRPMKFNNLTNHETDVKETTQKLVELRRMDLPLIYGDTKFLLVTDKTFAYARTYFNDITIVAFNKDSSPQTLRFKIPKRFVRQPLLSQFNSNWKIKDDVITMELKPYSFEIITGSKIQKEEKNISNRKHSL